MTCDRCLQGRHFRCQAPSSCTCSVCAKQRQRIPVPKKRTPRKRNPRPKAERLPRVKPVRQKDVVTCRLDVCHHFWICDGTPRRFCSQECSITGRRHGRRKRYLSGDAVKDVSGDEICALVLDLTRRIVEAQPPLNNEALAQAKALHEQHLAS